MPPINRREIARLSQRLRARLLPYEVERELLSNADEAAPLLLHVLDAQPVRGKQWPVVHAMSILFRMRGAVRTSVRDELLSAFLRQTRRDEVEVRSKAATLLAGWLATAPAVSRLKPVEQERVREALIDANVRGLTADASALVERAIHTVSPGEGG